MPQYVLITLIHQHITFKKYAVSLNPWPVPFSIPTESMPSQLLKYLDAALFPTEKQRERMSSTFLTKNLRIWKVNMSFIMVISRYGLLMCLTMFLETWIFAQDNWVIKLQIEYFFWSSNIFSVT